MNKKMTIFYIKKDYEIESITMGEQDLRKYADMRVDIAEIVYGYIIIDYDEFIYKNRRLFKVINEDDDFKIVLKENSKENLEKYL